MRLVPDQASADPLSTAVPAARTAVLAEFRWHLGPAHREASPWPQETPPLAYTE